MQLLTVTFADHTKISDGEMSYFSRVTEYLRSKVIEYFNHSSIQGLRYITEPGRNITERLFWIVTCIASSYGTYFLFMGALNNFYTTAVSFTIETTYLDWNSTFAAVSVCEGEGTGIDEAAHRVFGAKWKGKLSQFLKDIVFFQLECKTCRDACLKDLDCSYDLRNITAAVRIPCEKFMSRCSWNNVPFNCCDEFLPIDTEIGRCYTINSLHTKKNGEKMELVSNRFTGPGVLELYIYLDKAKVFLHSPEDIPYINHPIEANVIMNRYYKYTTRFYMSHTHNEPLVKTVPVDQRRCMFPWENHLTIYQYYSYSACVTECRMQAQLAYCNCTIHFLPESKKYKDCDAIGLGCIGNHAEIIRKLKTKDNPNEGIVCDCMSSCEEPEYGIISTDQEEMDEELDDAIGKDPSKLVLMLENLPNYRFRRNVFRTPLDLAVSMGGTAGLFLGASWLSAVELVVFMLLRFKRHGSGERRSSRVVQKKAAIFYGKVHERADFIRSRYHLNSRENNKENMPMPFLY